MNNLTAKFKLWAHNTGASFSAPMFFNMMQKFLLYETFGSRATSILILLQRCTVLLEGNHFNRQFVCCVYYSKLKAQHRGAPYFDLLGYGKRQRCFGAASILCKPLLSRRSVTANKIWKTLTAKFQIISFHTIGHGVQPIQSKSQCQQ